jgi:hypothetical protein
MNRWRWEFAFAGLFSALAVITAVIPDWIEVVFGIEPDGGSGSLEWIIVGVLGVLAVLLGALGYRDRRRSSHPHTST